MIDPSIIELPPKIQISTYVRREDYKGDPIAGDERSNIATFLGVLLSICPVGFLRLYIPIQAQFPSVFPKIHKSENLQRARGTVGFIFVIFNTFRMRWITRRDIQRPAKRCSLFPVRLLFSIEISRSVLITYYKKDRMAVKVHLPGRRDVWNKPDGRYISSRY